LSALTVLSLLLCVAVAVMWVRSYWVSDELIWTTAHVDVSTGRAWNENMEYVQSSRGWWAHGNHSTDPDAWDRYEHSNRPEGVRLREFEWRRTPAPLAIQFRATRYGGETPVPYWATVLALAVLPTCRVTLPRVRRWLERRRRDCVGRCGYCGYDLRATPDRCPECGRGTRGATA
jgi:hypothetical protein